MEKNSKTSNEKKDKRDIALVVLLIVIFCYNAFKFSNTEGNDHPLISPLFNMIIILIILIFIFHGKRMIPFEVEHQQTCLEKYFKKIKNQK